MAINKAEDYLQDNIPFLLQVFIIYAQNKFVYQIKLERD